jgi:presenilin-like A22 family membrane protease
MKHNLKITAILLGMFLLTQFIGLAVLQADIFHIEQEINGTIQTVLNPYLSFIAPPEVKTTEDSFSMFTGLIIAFIIAISLFFLFTKFKIEFILKFWFFSVVTLALFLSIFAFEKLTPFKINIELALIISLIIALPLAFIKIYKKGFILHNLTELFIYPGIATVFVPILSITTIIILLIIISIYDMWAVWKSKIMQKMVKYQINKLNILSGFFIPNTNKKTKQKIKLMKEKYKDKKILEKELKKKKFKINIAILGGGDIIFPIITAGVVMNAWGFIQSLFVIFGALLGLSYLFFFSKKKKFYPAMPFITIGIFLGMLISWIIF